MGKKLKLVSGSLLVLTLAAVGFTLTGSDEEIVDTRYNGAYRLADGSLATIVPSNSERVRLRHFDDGQVHSLYHDGQGNFQVADGISSQAFIASGQFKYSSDGQVAGLSWVKDDQQTLVERIPLRSETVTFTSGELTLRGKLTLPEGEGPFPVVIMIHGSEAYSGVDYYHLPYMLAAKGIAGFKFDKRGTGGSQGEYTQHFPTLAGDVIAAAEFLKSRATIDPNRINLAGFSQGGWIAPLVAQQIDIHAYLVAFGCAVPVQREDRWGYVKRLQDRGFGADAIALADKMNAELVAIVDHGDEAGWDRLFALRDKHIDDDWFQAIIDSDSMLGFIAGMATKPGASLIPGFGWKMYYRWKRGDGPRVDRTYDPRVTLTEINTPSLWLLPSEDSSAPTFETTAVLDELRNIGKSVEYKVYQGAEHGNVLFEKDENGELIYTGYAKSYFTDMVDWFKSQNEIAAKQVNESDL